MTEPQGKLVTSLLAEFGPDAFRLLYRALDRNAPAEEVSSLFEGIYGRTLDDEWQRVHGLVDQGYCAPFWACRSAVSSAGTFELSRGRGGASSAIRLGPDLGANVWVDPNRVGIRPCSGTPADSRVPTLQRDSTWVYSGGIDLALQLVDGEATVTGDLEILPALAENCEDAVALPSPGPGTLQPIVVPAMDDVRYLHLEANGGTSLQIGSPIPFARGQDGWLIETCARCDAGMALDCVLEGGAALEQEIWLRLSRDGIEPRKTLAVVLSFF